MCSPEEEKYTIRLPATPGPTLCSDCGRSFVATGPVGHANGEVRCDLCFLQACNPLGMVLAVVTMVRGIGAIPPPHGPMERSALERALAELYAFARIYERHAARWGPRRADFVLPEKERKH